MADPVSAAAEPFGRRLSENVGKAVTLHTIDGGDIPGTIEEVDLDVGEVVIDAGPTQTFVVRIVAVVALEFRKATTKKTSP